MSDMAPLEPLVSRAVFDAMDIAALVMRGPACVACNRAAVRLFDLGEAGELVGKTPLDFAPPLQPDGRTSAEFMRDNFMQAHAKGAHVFDWLTSKRDGEPMVLEVRFTMLPEPSDLYVCTAIDISERRRAEQALRESEGRFRAVFERAFEGILVADGETRRFRLANPASCHLLGYEPEELLALGVDDIHPPESVPEVLTAFARQLAGELTSVDTLCLRKDGSVVPVNIRSASLELDGRPHLVGFFTDLTSRQQLHEERLRAQKLEAVGRLAGGIAHDFNNLLQGVFGFISLARLKVDDREKSAFMLGEAETALHQAVHLTSQLLAFAKGGRPQKALLEIGPVIESATRLALSGSRAHSRVEVAEDVYAIDADEGQLVQAVQNLVVNAAQAMPSGGTVELDVYNVTAPAPTVPARLAAGPYVAIRVRDRGVGIAPQHLAKIFDPYFTTKEKGSGLGLATTYAIVDNHRGVIDVRSLVGEGSTFTIFLPAAPRARAPLEPTPIADTSRRAGARLLVMDDDATVRAVTAELLKSLGHSVDVAAHGEAAVDRFREAQARGAPYDLVILDLTIRGGVGGLETARRLRALSPEVRLVVSSGYSDDTASREFAAQPFLAFLKKPFDLATLRATLEPLL